MSHSKVGMLRTAADLFEELGLYKEMVECYVAQEHPNPLPNPFPLPFEGCVFLRGF